MRITTCFFFLLTILAPSALRAQWLYQSAADLEKRGFTSTTTYISLTGDAQQDDRMRAAFEGWNLTRGVEFVEPGKPLGNMADESRSYISRWSDTNGNWLVLWQGHRIWEGSGRNKFTDASYWKSWIVAIPLGNKNERPAEELPGWDLPVHVHTFEQLVREVMRGSVNPPQTGSHAGELDGMRPSLIKQKTLLICGDHIGKPSQEAFSTGYPYPVEVVSIDRIIQAINERDARYMFVLFPPTQRYEIAIHDAATLDLVFAEYLGSKGAVDKKFVKSLVKAMDK